MTINEAPANACAHSERMVREGLLLEGAKQMLNSCRPKPPVTPPEVIHIVVPGIPKPQPRARAYARGDHAAMYDPKTANGWKNSVAAAAIPHRPAKPLTGPLRVDIVFYLPRPKRLMRKADPSGPVWCHDLGRNDRDNLDKAVLDTLTDIGMWEDDGQVCCGEIRKFYHSKGGRPGAIITIQPAPPEVTPPLQRPLELRL